MTSANDRHEYNGRQDSKACNQRKDKSTELNFE